MTNLYDQHHSKFNAGWSLEYCPMQWLEICEQLLYFVQARARQRMD